MRRKDLARKRGLSGVGLAFGLLVATCSFAAPARAADDGRPSGMWDNMLEMFGVKAKPSGSAPAFIARTRPDPAKLNFMQVAQPHKVSPLAVKKPAEIAAEERALDAAKERQLQPVAPRPIELRKPSKAEKAKPVAVAD